MIRTRLQGDTPFFPNMLNNGKIEVCLKEDVDKTISELNSTIEELIKAKKSAEEILKKLIDYGIIKEWYFNGEFNITIKEEH